MQSASSCNLRCLNADRWIRILLRAAAAEAAAILALVALVAIFGPEDPDGAQVYAERLGRFVGPFAGAVFGVIGGYLVSRCATANRVLHGTLFGLLFAIIDGAVLIAGHASFEWLFVISNAGRIIGGAIGGAIASRNRSAALT